ncbi:MAG: 6,7-dimethyl-8-ribityllumazine synthase [Xanthobacteraceae bacterium]
MAKPRRGAEKAAAVPKGARILVVEARFYDDIADALLDGAKRALEAAGASFDVVSVPGALEIPTAIAIAVDAAKSKRKPYEGAIALGCVIRGETTHYEIVGNESARALIDLSVTLRLPIGNGILTVETNEQAWARARTSGEDKGGGAAKAALALAAIKRDVAKAKR